MHRADTDRNPITPTCHPDNRSGNPYVYELYHNLLELLESQGRPKHGVSARLIRSVLVHPMTCASTHRSDLTDSIPYMIGMWTCPTS